MVSLMRTGQYDGVSASGNATLRLMVGGFAAPVNVKLLTNYKDVNATLKDQPYNTYQGTHFGAPHGWGANLLMSRTDIVKPAPDSWGAVFDPNSPYKGKITAYDDPIYIADAALYLRSTRPDLKITDPYELDNTQFQAAVSLLKQQRANIGSYWSDYTKEQAAFANGDSVIGTTWQVITNLLLTDTHPTPRTGDRAQRGLHGLVGHLDGLGQGGAPELHAGRGTTGIDPSSAEAGGHVRFSGASEPRGVQTLSRRRQQVSAIHIMLPIGLSFLFRQSPEEMQYSRETAARASCTQFIMGTTSRR